jgi:hypothetical protein
MTPEVAMLTVRGFSRSSMITFATINRAPKHRPFLMWMNFAARWGDAGEFGLALIFASHAPWCGCEHV